MTEQRTIRIFGRVQGVNFRASVRAAANRLGVNGFARNEPDGSVVIVAEGAAAALDELAAWCQTGPARARVDRVVITAGLPSGATSFTIG